MIELTANHIYKRFISNWVIEDFHFKFEKNSITGIKGRNGSGKSTLLRILAGFMVSSEGNVSYSVDNEEIAIDEIYKYYTYAAPYIGIIEEMKASELFNVVSGVKNYKISDVSEFLEMVYLSKDDNKLIKYYSDGMKQRLKLGFSILSDSKLLFLDEPSSYLDSDARNWMKKLLLENSKDKTIIIASNDDQDFELCSEVIDISKSI